MCMYMYIVLYRYTYLAMLLYAVQIVHVKGGILLKCFSHLCFNRCLLI